MRATTKNSLRQIRHQLGSLLGVMIIVGVAVGFYATLKTSAETYSSDGESYFARYHMPSAILYGSDFSPDDLQKVEKVSGASTAELRATVDARRGNDTLRLQSYDIHDPRVNVPYIYNGQAPRTADECLLLKRYAAANNVHVGDKVAVSTNSFTDSCTVTGLATSPEHAYLAKNAATPIADPADFGILYVDNRFAERNHVPFSQIALLMSDMGKLGDVERALGNDQSIARSSKPTSTAMTHSILMSASSTCLLISFLSFSSSFRQSSSTLVSSAMYYATDVKSAS